MPKHLAALLALALCAQLTQAQTLRFHTSVGAFDMRLNPTGDANLQPLVDNMLANVAAGVYYQNVINRAAPGFVMQMGGFSLGPGGPTDLPEGGFAAVDSFGPIVVDSNNDGVVDFDTLSNTRGTVSLALSAGNPNSGSSSFFVNVGQDNSFLDAQGFVPFAVVDDLATIDRIMGLNSLDLSAEAGQSGSLAYTDVPLADDGEFVFIESVAVISTSSVSFKGPLLTALDIENPTPSGAGLNAATSPNIALATAGPSELISPGFPELDPPAVSVPEPTALALLALAGAVAAHRVKR